SRSELVQHLINELGAGSDQAATEETHNNSANRAKNVYESINTTIFQAPWRKEKLKGKERARIQDRALGTVDETIKALDKSQLYIVDLPEPVIRKLVGVDLSDEEVFRRTFDAQSAQQREYLGTVRKALLLLKKEGHTKAVWVCSQASGSASHLLSL
ncbi:hypothetical protein HDU98_009227, partial [Podochytrium sp. JEL0797]